MSLMHMFERLGHFFILNLKMVINLQFVVNSRVCNKPGINCLPADYIQLTIRLQRGREVSEPLSPCLDHVL